MTAGCVQPWTAKAKLQLVLGKLCLKKYVILLDHKARPKKIRDSRATIVGNWCGWANFFLFFFENLMLDCMHKFRARSHKMSTPCKISTPSSRYGFSHDLHVFFFDVHVENTGMTLAFRLAWSVLCCGHENRVRTRVTRGSGQPKKISGRDFLVRAGPGISNFFGLA